MATHLRSSLLTAQAFLEIDFGDHKAELDNGVIWMMAGGTRRHARVQSNIISALRLGLRGSGCAAYGANMGVKTRLDSLRYPDVSVFCGREGVEFDEELMADDPHVVFEVLSAGTARTDLRLKLDEYKALSSIDTVVFVDIATERLRVVQRIGRTSWSDDDHDEPNGVALPSLDLVLAHDDIFARD